jgi:hypothetical protein
VAVEAVGSLYRGDSSPRHRSVAVLLGRPRDGLVRDECMAQPDETSAVNAIQAVRKR